MNVLRRLIDQRLRTSLKPKAGNGVSIQTRNFWVSGDQPDKREQMEALNFFNDYCKQEKLAKKWKDKMFYQKPYMVRKQRYDRWERRKSITKIRGLLETVEYEKARSAVPLNKRLIEIFEGNRNFEGKHNKEVGTEKKGHMPSEAGINDPIHGI